MRESQSLPGDDVSPDTRSGQGLSSGVSAFAFARGRRAARGTPRVVWCLTVGAPDRVRAADVVARRGNVLLRIQSRPPR